ncbi:hypothetical protein K492DRAFT_82017 [Lichtheimia hyalospora FSU 10163]|nr:hypothetical protein K492DRAFT_82017 [Lichtheimia hyalospora FSU 10163]
MGNPSCCGSGCKCEQDQCQCTTEACKCGATSQSCALIVANVEAHALVPRVKIFNLLNNVPVQSS